MVRPWPCHLKVSGAHRSFQLTQKDIAANDTRTGTRPHKVCLDEGLAFLGGGVFVSQAPETAHLDITPALNARTLLCTWGWSHSSVSAVVVHRSLAVVLVQVFATELETRRLHAVFLLTLIALGCGPQVFNLCSVRKWWEVEVLLYTRDARFHRWRDGRLASYSVGCC